MNLFQAAVLFLLAFNALILWFISVDVADIRRSKDKSDKP